MDNLLNTEASASEVTVTNMAAYGKYTILEALPNCVDGLRLVHRRILVTMKDQVRVKGSAIIGETMRRYHPHGDNGIWDAVVRLCQPFNQCQPLLYSEGNIGAYGGGDAAAARYLDVSYAPFAKDVYPGIVEPVGKRALVETPCETGTGTEPAFLVPTIPMALLTGTQGIGIGFRSCLPIMNLVNVCDLALKYIELKHLNPITGSALAPSKTYAKWLIPDYPIAGLVMNEREMLQELARGNYGVALVTSGKIEMHPTRINVRTIPYGKDFNTDVKATLGQLVKTTSFINANCTEVLDLTTGILEGDLELVLKRGVDPFSILNQLTRTIRATAARTPVWNFSNHKGQLLALDPIQLVSIWHQKRCDVIHSDLNQRSKELIHQKQQLEALQVAVKHSDQIYQIFKRAATEDEAILPLCKRYHLIREQARYLFSLKFEQITKMGKEKLEQQYADVIRQNQELQAQYSKIDETICNQVTKIKQTYGPKATRRTILPRFLGALEIVGSGVIQFRDLKELGSLIQEWSTKELRTHWYPTRIWKKIPYTDQQAYAGLNPDWDLPQVFRCDNFRVIPNGAQHQIVINLADRTVFRMKDLELSSTSSKLLLCPVADDFTAIHRDGSVTQMRYSEISLRNNLNAIGVKSDLLYAGYLTGSDLILATANTEEPNTLTLERIQVGTKHARKFLGTTIHLGLFSSEDAVLLTLPSKVLQRSSNRYLYLPKLSEVMQSNVVKLNLAKSTITTKQTVAPYCKGSPILMVR